MSEDEEGERWGRWIQEGGVCPHYPAGPGSARGAQRRGSESVQLT